MQREHPLPSCSFPFPKAVSSSPPRGAFPKGSGEKVQGEESPEAQGISGLSRKGRGDGT